MPLCGNAYKVSVTGLAFYIIWHEKHYVDQPPPVAFPPLVPYGTTFPRGIGRATKGKRLYGQARRLTSPDLHILCRMCTVDNEAPRGNLPICDSIVSTGYSAPACGGKVVAPATKGGQTGMVHEVYDALFFSPYPSFPLEGKSREAGKGVRGRAPIGCSIAVLTANRWPPRAKRCTKCSELFPL